MPFTKGRWEAYTQHTDGTEYVIAPLVITGVTGVSKVAAGDYAVSLGNSITAELVYRLPGTLRLGEPHLEDTQLLSQALTGPAYEQYNPPVGPPYTIQGVNAQAPLPVLRGIKLNSIDIVYLVGTADLTALTVGIFAKQDIDGSAPLVTTLLAQAVNGLSLVASADRYVTNVVIPAANREFIVTPDSVVTAEVDIETPAGGTADLFGIVFYYDFNFN